MNIDIEIIGERQMTNVLGNTFALVMAMLVSAALLSPAASVPADAPTLTYEIA